MLKTLYQSLMANLVLALILCGGYPLVVTVLGQLVFKDQANGSLITVRDAQGQTQVVGSKLIGQASSKPEYFHPRPSAAGSGYDAANSSGSNLGPTNQKFADTLKANIETVLKENPTLKSGTIPTDLVTASGSGLDPHLSPEAALVQVPRVAKARGMSEESVRKLVSDHTEGPQWGIFGEKVVNVLMLNLALEDKK